MWSGHRAAAVIYHRSHHRVGQGSDSREAALDAERRGRESQGERRDARRRALAAEVWVSEGQTTRHEGSSRSSASDLARRQRRGPGSGPAWSRPRPFRCGAVRAGGGASRRGSNRRGAAERWLRGAPSPCPSRPLPQGCPLPRAAGPLKPLRLPLSN